MKIIRIMLILIGTVLLVWFAIPPCFVGILNLGGYVGIAFSVCLLVYGLFFVIVNNIIAAAWKMASGKVIIIVLSFLLLGIIYYVADTTYKMANAADNPSTGDTTVVVLGCRVQSLGPSLMLEERLEAALSFLLENEDTKCILSGGKGADEPMSEAECMYEWLTNRGIDKSRLYIEDKSTSTKENLEFSQRIIEENGLCGAVTIVTNDFHQYRALQAAKKLGMESYAVSGKTPLTMLPTYYVRELFGILYEYVKL